MTHKCRDRGIQMLKDGATNREVSEELSVPYNTVAMWRSKLGLASPKSKRRGYSPNNPKGRALGLYAKDTCPKCGATRSAQKRPLRRNLVDFSTMVLISSLHPSDGVRCPKCGLVFRVDGLDADGEYVLSEDVSEVTPNYCPNCAQRLWEVNR